MIEKILRRFSNVALDHRITNLERRMTLAADQINALHTMWVTLSARLDKAEEGDE